MHTSCAMEVIRVGVILKRSGRGLGSGGVRHRASDKRLPTPKRHCRYGGASHIGYRHTKAQLGISNVVNRVDDTGAGSASLIISYLNTELQAKVGQSAAILGTRLYSTYYLRGSALTMVKGCDTGVDVICDAICTSIGLAKWGYFALSAMFWICR